MVKEGESHRCILFTCKKNRTLKPVEITFKSEEECWALLAHSCNPGYSGGRDEKDGGSKPDHGK
jgi:hypothetical protein